MTAYVRGSRRDGKPRCAYWTCSREGHYWIGESHDGEAYVCEAHLQHTVETDDGTVLYRHLRKARKAQEANLGR